MRVLIIDNQDSFSYNLKHYVSQFSEFIDVIRSDRLKIKDVAKYQKIIFSPGPGLPEEYPILNEVLKVYGAHKSILGVCLGKQSIAEYYGGKLENLSNVKHGVSSELSHYNNCNLFANISKDFRVGHYHSWVISKDLFPNVLEVTAVNSEGLIMAIKHRKLDIKALQFHPESILTENGLQIIENWLKY